MKTFQIEVIESGHKFIEVEAIDESSALETAQNEYRQGNITIDPRYEKTTDFYLALQ